MKTESPPSTPSRTLRRLLRAMHTPGLEVCPTSIYLLTEAVRREPVTATALAVACFGEGGKYIHRRLVKLEEAGYIDWTRQAGWTRAQIRVTAHGRQLLGALGQIVAETHA